MSHATETLRLAVIGDIHGHWSATDTDHFNRSDYQALLFAGDLPPLRGTRRRIAESVAREIARLEKPAFVVPGNHDGTTIGQLVAEILSRPWLGLAGSFRQGRRVDRLDAWLGDACLGGYSGHALGGPEHDLALIVARPHAMGNGLSFPGYIKKRYRIRTMEQSAERLEAVIDERPEKRLIFLAHNGPAGLGGGPTDPWGSDSRRTVGDCGDPDLTRAIGHARRMGREVLAVIAGHMHLQTKQGAERTWRVERDGSLYVNAARVPRLRTRGESVERHHVALNVGEEGCTAAERWV